MWNLIAQNISKFGCANFIFANCKREKERKRERKREREKERGEKGKLFYNHLYLHAYFIYFI